MATTFLFARPSQEQVIAELAALDAERHAAHRPGEPRRYCPLCARQEVTR